MSPLTKFFREGSITVGMSVNTSLLTKTLHFHLPKLLHSQLLLPVEPDMSEQLIAAVVRTWQV